MPTNVSAHHERYPRRTLRMPTNGPPTMKGIHAGHCVGAVREPPTMKGNDGQHGRFVNRPP